MLIEQMTTAIESRASMRFELIVENEKFMPGSPSIPQLAGARVCRLRRTGAEAGWRTILLAKADFSSDAIQGLYRWAADVRDQLPEPETADLYMFLLIPGIPDEEAARVETDDRFCRKFVLRTSESAPDLLDRTFLALVSSESNSATIGDPLQAALVDLAKEHPWTEAHLSVWREILLAGGTGAELAHALRSTTTSDSAS